MSSSISSPMICPQRAKVRVLGKIRNFNESENCGRDLKPWITVRKPQDDDLSVNKVAVSFSDQSSNASKKDSSYELNDCYQQDEDIDVLFTREIRPLISEVFKGGAASIIAYGARGSGKTALIQGMTDKPGLSMMAMGEILTKARDLGKWVFLSIYEVFQEHAYDLLDSKRSEIQVLEDARGRIKLKGLSQVSVESLSQFEEYRSRSLSGKTSQKIPVEVPKRSHKVVVVYLSSMNEASSINCGGKMNFVDLAGYEDTRRKSSEGNNLLESVKVNKSLHAIMNVIYALNTNDSRVPFRESKLTRMLQESLGGSNPILLLACMNPLFCQDTIHTVNVASRSCQNNSRVSTDLAKKATGSTRVQALPSQKIVRPLGTPKSVKKQVDCNVQLSTKKASIMSSGRKLKEAKEIIGSQAESPKRDDGLMIDNLQESTTTVTILQSEEHPGNNSLINSHLDLLSDEVCQHNSTVEHEGENPLFCQNTIHTVSVASRSCHNKNRVQTDSTKKVNSSTKVQAQKIVRPFGTPKVVKKQVDCNVLLSTKKASIMSSGRKGKESKEIISSQSKVSRVKQPALKVKSPKGDGSANMIENLQESTTTVTILQTEEDSGNNLLKNSHLDSVSDEVFQHNSVVEHEGEVHTHNSNVEHEGEVCSQNSTVEHEGEVVYKDNANNNLNVTPAVTNERSAIDHGTYSKDLLTLGGVSPPLSERLRELSTNLKLFCSTTPSRQKLLQETVPIGLTEITEPKTPDTENRNMNAKNCSPWDAFSKGSSRMKDSLVQQSLNFLNTASKEDLKKLKGIGEKRATYILELREESPVPFKNLEDLTEIGLSAKQIKGMMKNVAGELFS